MEPVERGKGMSLVDDVFGGAIPATGFPRSNEESVTAAGAGYLAGFPVVDFRGDGLRRQISRRRFLRHAFRNCRVACVSRKP